MALQTWNGEVGAATGRLFGAALADAASPPRLATYRCACCGEEIARDSLAVSCRCSEECYADDGACGWGGAFTGQRHAA